MYIISGLTTIVNLSILTIAIPTKSGSQSPSCDCNDGTPSTSTAPSSTTTEIKDVSSLTSPTTPTSSSQTQNQGQPLATILAEFTSQYTVSTGAVDFNTDRGLISRSPQKGGKDITTLLTFTVPSEYSQRTCQVVFDIGADPTSSVTGTGKMQLFTSLAPVTADASTWPSGNLRDQFQGTLIVNTHGRATWEAGSGPEATYDGKFPCDAIAGRPYGGELVPVGDDDSISWLAGTKDGLKVLIL